MWSLHKPGVHRPSDSRERSLAAWDLEELASTVRPDAAAEPARSDESMRGRERNAAAEVAAATAAEAAADAAARAARMTQERLDAERLAHEQAVADAYTRGRAEGRAEGERDATERLREAVQAAEQALAALRAGEHQWTDGALARENLCALAAGIARHIIARKVSADAKIVRELVRAAIAEFPVDEPLRIRVHPDDLAEIEGAREIAQGIGDRTASWVADAMIIRGGCLVEGREHIIDGRVDTALERVYRRLTNTHA